MTHQTTARGTFGYERCLSPHRPRLSAADKIIPQRFEGSVEISGQGTFVICGGVATLKDNSHG